MIFNSTSRRSDAKKVLEKTGYTLEQLIMFTGVDGIHELQEIVSNAKIVVGWLKPYASIKIRTDVVFIELSICTDISDRFVEIKHLVIQPSFTRLGLGTKIFCNQVLQLNNHNFQKIVCVAIGGSDSIVEGNGFITAGLWGMSMDIESKEKYDILLNNWGIQLMPLYELLRQDVLSIYQDRKDMTLSGWDFWCKYGINWNGTFDLDESSENMNRLGRYLIRKQRKSDRRKVLAKPRKNTE